MDDLQINPHCIIPGYCLSWTAARSGGPGGQNVNKVASKVDLRFDIHHCDNLTPTTKARLRAMAGTRIDRDGRVIITSQVTRDQQRNLQDARDKLAALVARALVRPKRRRATKPTRGSKERRLTSKRHQSEKKRNRKRVDRD